MNDNDKANMWVLWVAVVIAATWVAFLVTVSWHFIQKFW